MMLSIIIPAYNCEKYICECLDSCLEQDIPANDYEIICIDDGSTDKTTEILDGYAAKYIQIKLIHQKNSGVSAARNTGIEQAKGDYIWFVDADDLIQENILSELSSILSESENDIFFLKTYFFEDELTEDEYRKKKRRELMPTEIRSTTCTQKLFRREIIEKNHIRYLSEISFGEDTLFVFDYLKYTKRSGTLDIPTYFQRRHSDSLTLAGNKLERECRRIDSVCKIINYLVEEYQTDPDSLKDRTRKYIYSTRKYLMDLLTELPLKEGTRLIKRFSSLGIFEIEKNVPRCGKAEKVYPYCHYYFTHCLFLFREKVAIRLFHPIRTLKHIFKGAK
ncbi:MAG: glycosyltransferase family 2 protein [Ruminococcaceae bacterium]|nr:glycosyltransferase family 2 protein [Oscillospiraceae bacterium]